MTTTIKRKRLTTAITGVVFGALLCFLSFTGVSATAVDLFEDDFETYDWELYDVNGQGYWYPIQACYSWHVGTTTVQSGSQALEYGNSGFCNGSYKDLTGVATTTASTGSMSFNFYFTDPAPTNGLYFFIQYDNEKTSPERYQNAVLRLDMYDGITLRGGYYLNSSSTVANTIPLNTWNEIEIEYDLQNEVARAKLTGSDWSDYVAIRDVPYLTGYHFEGGSYTIRIDNIQWGEGEGWLPYCTFGTFVSLCETQELCEYYNGYWVNDYCWQTIPATTTDWISYYETHSDFATSTAFIEFLSSFTAPFLQNIQNWLNSFAVFFDSTKAIAYGEQLGGAIPTARGYLAVFNSFFGDFPLSEIFIFFLTAMVVFVVYKQIRNLINLIKP